MPVVGRRLLTCAIVGFGLVGVRSHGRGLWVSPRAQAPTITVSREGNRVLDMKKRTCLKACSMAPTPVAEMTANRAGLGRGFDWASVQQRHRQYFSEDRS